MASLTDVSEVTPPEARRERKGSSEYHRIKIENLRRELEAKID